MAYYDVKTGSLYLDVEAKSVSFIHRAPNYVKFSENTLHFEQV